MEYILFGYVRIILFQISRNETVFRFEVALNTNRPPNSASRNSAAPLIHARALPPLFANPCSSVTAFQ